MRAVRSMLPMAAKALVLIGATAFFAAPAIWLLLAGFMERRDLLQSPPDLRFTPVLSNYATVIAEQDAISRLLTTAGLCLVAALVAALIAFGQVGPVILRRRSLKNLEASLLSFYAVPGSVIAIPFFLYVSALGVPGPVAYVGGIGATAILISVLMLMGYARSLKRSSIESLGFARPGSLVGQVPVLARELRSVLGVVVVFAFLTGWQDLIIGIVTSDSDFTSANVSILGLITPIGTFWGQIAALSSPSLFLALSFSILASDNFLRGFSFGR